MHVLGPILQKKQTESHILYSPTTTYSLEHLQPHFLYKMKKHHLQKVCLLSLSLSLSLSFFLILLEFWSS